MRIRASWPQVTLNRVKNETGEKARSVAIGKEVKQAGWKQLHFWGYDIANGHSLFDTDSLCSPLWIPKRSCPGESMEALRNPATIWPYYFVLFSQLHWAQASESPAPTVEIPVDLLNSKLFSIVSSEEKEQSVSAGWTGFFFFWFNKDFASQSNITSYGVKTEVLCRS